MVKPLKVSAALQKKHSSETAISLNGKVVATGKNSMEALKRAKKVIPNIEEKEFLVSYIYPKYVAA